MDSLQRVSSITSIIGNLSTLILALIAFIWGLGKSSDIVRNIRYWIINIFYGHTYYNKYKQCVISFFGISKQPVFPKDVFINFNDVNIRKKYEVLWLNLVEMSGIHHNQIFNSNEDPIRTIDDKITLKTSLETLIILLISHTHRFNYDMPWLTPIWRQKTMYGLIEIKSNQHFFIGLNIDDKPHNIDVNRVINNIDALKIWNDGYLGFHEEIFKCDSIEALSIHLNTITNATITTHVITPLRLSDLLCNFGKLLSKGCHNSPWEHIGHVCRKYGFELYWSKENEIKNIVTFFDILFEEVNKIPDTCEALKHEVFLILYRLINGSYDCRYFPRWSYKRTWEGPNYVYFV